MLESMREGAILSALLHGIVILLLLLGLPELFRQDLSPPAVIPIEVINIADLTQAPAPKAKPKADKVKEQPEEKPVLPKPTPVADETPKPEEKPNSEVKPEPTLSMDDLLAPFVEAKPQEEEKPKEKPKEQPKEKPKEKEKPKPKKDFMSLLNNIEKTEASSKGEMHPDQDITSTADHAATNVHDILSITELDLLRRQLAACWNVPAGAKDAKDLIITIKVEMNSDATVRTAEFVKANKSLSDPYVKAAADAAKRAVKNPKCNPLKLPLNRYEKWKSIVINFNPQNLL